MKTRLGAVELRLAELERDIDEAEVQIVRLRQMEAEVAELRGAVAHLLRWEVAELRGAVAHLLRWTAKADLG